MTPIQSRRLALTVDPEIPVPPRLYGGIERVVDMLVEGLGARGWEVFLFAHPDSATPARLFPYPALRSQAKRDLVLNTWHVFRHVARLKPDLIHSFGRLAYLTPLLPTAIPKIMSYQRVISRTTVAWGRRLSQGSLRFTGCSRRLIEGVAGIGDWRVVYNGVRMASYPFQPSVPADAPLVFLGRLEEIKGPHLAVRAAKASGRKLVLAGNRPAGKIHADFFEREVAPHVDGQRVRYAGPVDDLQKARLLGGAAALLMPILWEEPFGIVMAEALACGTPVIGLRRGSVPEVVTHGIDGFVCDSVDEMVDAVGSLSRIDRSRCRQTAQSRFSDQAIVGEYERLYLELLERPFGE